jgi:3-hydroxyacyl-[acyl-carrier-protein] dehydratase
MKPSHWTNVDRIINIEPNQRAVAIRNVPNTLSILETHFPRFPVLPGVLILGSLGELAARLVGQGDGRRWVLRGAEQVRFRHFVQPGDQMELTVEIKEHSPESVICSGTVRVDGKSVTTVRKLHLSPYQSREPR